MTTQSKSRGLSDFVVGPPPGRTEAFQVPFAKLENQASGRPLDGTEATSERGHANDFCRCPKSTSIRSSGAHAPPLRTFQPGLPSFLGLSAKLSWIPLPGNTMTPIGSASSIAS